MKKNIKVYFRFVRKRLNIVFISNTNRKLFHKYIVSNDDINNLSESVNKSFKIIDSCKYTEHIDVAENYIKIFSERFPFASIIEEVLNHTSTKKRSELKGFYDFTE